MQRFVFIRVSSSTFCGDVTAAVQLFK